MDGAQTHWVFTAEYGIEPKQAAWFARFEHARARLEGGEPIAEVAVECAHADQAHLTREFATITGHPPANSAARACNGSATLFDGALGDLLFACGAIIFFSPRP